MFWEREIVRSNFGFRRETGPSLSWQKPGSFVSFCNEPLFYFDKDGFDVDLICQY